MSQWERQRFERCILRLGDPVAEGLGPHGSMIGGPGKPITIHYERAERTTPLAPLPLSWWDYPRARLRILPPGGQQAAYSYLRDLAGAHLAGVPNRPTAPRLARMFRSAHLSPADRDILAQLFGALPPPRFKSLRTLGGISLYEMARALHITRTGATPSSAGSTGLRFGRSQPPDPGRGGWRNERRPTGGGEKASYSLFTWGV